MSPGKDVKSDAELLEYARLMAKQFFISAAHAEWAIILQIQSLMEN